MGFSGFSLVRKPSQESCCAPVLLGCSNEIWLDRFLPLNCASSTVQGQKIGLFVGNFFRDGFVRTYVCSWILSFKIRDFLHSGVLLNGDKMITMFFEFFRGVGSLDDLKKQAFSSGFPDLEAVFLGLYCDEDVLWVLGDEIIEVLFRETYNPKPVLAPAEADLHFVGVIGDFFSVSLDFSIDAEYLVGLGSVSDFKCNLWYVLWNGKNGFRLERTKEVQVFDGMLERDITDLVKVFEAQGPRSWNYNLATGEKVGLPCSMSENLGDFFPNLCIWDGAWTRHENGMAVWQIDGCKPLSFTNFTGYILYGGSDGKRINYDVGSYDAHFEKGKNDMFEGGLNKEFRLRNSDSGLWIAERSLLVQHNFLLRFYGECCHGVSSFLATCVLVFCHHMDTGYCHEAVEIQSWFVHLFWVFRAQGNARVLLYADYVAGVIVDTVLFQYVRNPEAFAECKLEVRLRWSFHSAYVLNYCGLLNVLSWAVTVRIGDLIFYCNRFTIQNCSYLESYWSAMESTNLCFSLNWEIQFMKSSFGSSRRRKILSADILLASRCAHAVWVGCQATSVCFKESDGADFIFVKDIYFGDVARLLGSGNLLVETCLNDIFILISCRNALLLKKLSAAVDISAGKMEFACNMAIVREFEHKVEDLCTCVSVILVEAIARLCLRNSCGGNQAGLVINLDLRDALGWKGLVPSLGILSYLMPSWVYTFFWTTVLI